MAQPRLIILLGIIGLLSLAAILLMRISPAGEIAQAIPADETVTPTDPVLARLEEEIARNKHYLRGEELPVDIEKGLQSKVKYLEQKATERVDYLRRSEETLRGKMTAIANITLTPFPTEPSLPMPADYDGHFPEFYAPMYREAHFITAWLARTKERHLYILSGSYAKDPEQGVVYIENKNERILQKYQTPYKDGPLKISKLVKNLLYLEAESGRKYLLDIEQGVFVDQSGTPLPEPTPLAIHD